MIKIGRKQLQEGAILAHTVITPLGRPLSSAGSAVTRQLINRMKLYHAGICGIEAKNLLRRRKLAKFIKEREHTGKQNTLTESRQFQ